MDRVEVIDGEIFTDERGGISSVNGFDAKDVRRFYLIHHPDTAVIRGWNGHKFERKWFYCVKGAFALALVKIDMWENPSANLEPEIFYLSARKSRIIAVPAGYASCMKAVEPDSIMITLSDKAIAESAQDSWKFDKNMWVDWEKLEYEND